MHHQKSKQFGWVWKERAWQNKLNNALEPNIFFLLQDPRPWSYLECCPPFPYTHSTSRGSFQPATDLTTMHSSNYTFIDQKDSNTLPKSNRKKWRIRRFVPLRGRKSILFCSIRTNWFAHIHMWVGSSHIGNGQHMHSFYRLCWLCSYLANSGKFASTLDNVRKFSAWQTHTLILQTCFVARLNWLLFVLILIFFFFF